MYVSVDMSPTKEECKKAWHIGNAAGEGWSTAYPYVTIDEVMQVMIEQQYSVFFARETKDDIVVMQRGDRYIGIGYLYGPWLVELKFEQE